MDIKTKFRDICRELNMDKETEELAWKNYTDVLQKFTLDGDQCYWLCCALYAACRQSYRPTVGGLNEIVKGNCVSLTKLLRSCNVSLYDFFNKIKCWCEMANLSKDFLNQVKRLECGVSITIKLFNWYHQFFNQIFIVPPHEKKNKKSRPIKCAANKLYDLCWCLFLCAKNEHNNCTVDIVPLFYLLLCCTDIIYVNALAENRIDLINPNFEGVPNGWNTPEFDSSDIHRHCIIESLCKLAGEQNENEVTMAKSIKNKLWKEIMNEFIKTKILLANKGTFMEIISNNNFEPNLKSLNSAYEQYVLSAGEFDERILLYNTNFRKLNNNESSTGNIAYSNQNIRSVGLETPLTRRHYLPSKDTSETLAGATQNVRRLQDIADIKGPSEFISQSGKGTVQKLESKLDAMKALFISKFPNESEAAESRFNLARSLYYFLLDKIIGAELASKPKVDIQVLLEIENLNLALITCCVEIVLVTYNPQQKFPWVLNCFDVQAFTFVKIIEIVVKRQNGILNRDQIKHLNYVEERCLESLVWKEVSHVWKVFQEKKPLPPWTEVDLNKMARMSHGRNVLQSPNSAYDCFNSMATTPSTSESTRRDLFNAGKAAETRPSTEAANPTPADNKRNVPLSIFLRKFYELAWMRMKQLCKDLEMVDEHHMEKIWTLFEYSITHKTVLMQDRHLDQLIMCAIYIYIKVCEIADRTFTDIMKSYRRQPQADSNIYREVEVEKKKVDIIKFYNEVYVPKMSPYALNFNEKKKSQHDLLLSPHPTEKVNPPKKVSNSIYVHQMEKNEIQFSPNHITYEFHKSPAKDLDKMNEIVRKGKRNLTFEESVVIKKICKSNLHFQGKILGIKKDRQLERND